MSDRKPFLEAEKRRCLALGAEPTPVNLTLSRDECYAKHIDPVILVRSLHDVLKATLEVPSPSSEIGVRASEYTWAVRQDYAPYAVGIIIGFLRAKGIQCNPNDFNELEYNPYDPHTSAGYCI
jgi:hypothetical protein